MMTKQKLEQLLLLAADSEPDKYTGDKVSATIEGKLVEVQRTGYGRKVYGKRAPEFDAWVDGEKPLMWRQGRGRVLEVLYHAVSEEYKAKQAASDAEWKRNQKIREEKEEAERKARAEREAPAREMAEELMAKVWNKMVLRYGKQFTNEELAHFLRSVTFYGNTE